MKNRDAVEEYGRGPYHGAWRLELKSTALDADARFLNVLTATKYNVSKPVDAKYIKDDSRDGVELTLKGKQIKIWFNRAGTVGGEIVINNVSKPLTQDVQPQSGIIL